MNKRSDIREYTIFFIGWLIYFTSGILGIQGIITQSLLVVMLLWSLYYCVIELSTKHHASILNYLGCLYIMFFLYGTYNLLFVSNDFDYIKTISFSILPIFGHYHFLRKITISENWFMIIVVLLLLSAIGEFYNGKREMAEKIAQGLIRDRERNEMVMGAVYRFLPIIPLLFFIKKMWFKYTVLIVVLIFAVIGVKRGPILISVVCLFFILRDEMKQMRKKIRVSHIFIFVVAAIAGYYLLSRMILANDFLLWRFEQTMEGDSSNRDIMYSEMYGHFINETNLLIFIFGNGAQSTMLLMGYLAHNDWLQIALDQGLMGVILYLLYYVHFTKQWRKTKNHHELYMCMGLMIMILFLSSFFSMSINNMRIAAHFCIGYSLALLSNSRMQKTVG